MYFFNNCINPLGKCNFKLIPNEETRSERSIKADQGQIDLRNEGIDQL